MFVHCRDALSDLALHFLNKMKIMVVKDIEREDIEFICKVTSELETNTSLFVCLCGAFCNKTPR